MLGCFVRLKGKFYDEIDFQCVSRLGDIPMPSSCTLSRLSKDAERQLHLLPVVTCPPRVNSTGNYRSDHLVRLVSFAPTYRLAGGLNLPKIITCLCSDGRKRKQLVKGRDDPRQDAIMQQVGMLIVLVTAFTQGGLSRHHQSR